MSVRKTVLGVIVALAMVGLMVPAPALAADPPAHLFMSEYIEGSSFNKAIELYNATGAPVDPDDGDYKVVIYFNGNTTAGLTIELVGDPVPDGGVFVVTNSAASSEILAKADQVTSATNWFNGDDAVALVSGTTVVDVIGQIGFDPGSEWGSGDTSTQNNTLTRKPGVCEGDPNGTDPFDPSVEWDGHPQDTITSLGSHSCEATPALPVINEFVANHVGADDHEYVEVFGEADTDLSAFTILEIEGDGSGAGTVDEVIAVGSTDGDGFWSTGFLANDLENGSMTLLLVEGFSGSSGDDLDTDDDGTLDATPWADLVDAVAIDDGGASDRHYADTLLAGGFDGSSFTPGGASRIPDGANTGTASDWVRNDFDLAGIPGFPGSITSGEAFNTPGASNQLYTPPPEACGDEYTPIFEVQGSGASSPVDGDEVAVEGVVVGDFQTGMSGFHIQDATGDGDPDTSDGVFVYAPNAPELAAGDAVRVRGRVDEYFALTELTSVSQIWVCSTGNPLPSPVPLSLPMETEDEFEAVEGMLVTFPQDLTISEFYNFARYGEIVLSDGRQFQPTAVFEPGSPEAAALAVENLLGRITLDDGRTGRSWENPDPAIHPNGEEFTLDNRFRGGDLVTGVTGVMDYAFGLYRVQPTVGASYTAANERPEAPDEVGGRLTVASFNVLNYFTTLGSRGADTAEEFERQRDKIFSALAEIDADVVGLMEIENTVDALDDLVDGLNAYIGTPTYEKIATGPIGPDEIRVAFVYKPSSVAPMGEHAVLDTDAFLDPNDLGEAKNRPALAQTFVETATGATFTAVVNHLKSKGSECGAGDDDPEQGNCTLTRTLAAAELVAWLATDPTGSNDADVLLIGDYNAYDKEDPIDALLVGADGVASTADDFTDLLADSVGEYAYTYVFDGQLGYLDYGLASNTLVSQVTGATAWHINADEPNILDYDTTYKKDAQDALYEPNAYRSSDHDPVIVGLDLTEGSFTWFEPPIRDDNDAKAGRAIPVKFSLGGFFGFDIFHTDPYWAACENSMTYSGTALAGGLRYDGGRYVLVVKSDKDWSGACLDLVLEFRTGTVHTARFTFR